MDIKNMNQQNQIMILKADYSNQNYLISWLAQVHYQNILVCIKSSWLSIEELVRKLKTNGNEKSYQDSEVCWQVTGQTSIQVSKSGLKPPVDILLLPITNNEIFVPENDIELSKVAKTIRGVIKYREKREASFINATESITFFNDFLPVADEEVIAEYVVDNFHYPITAEMLGKTISVQIPKSTRCEVYITSNKIISNKYELRRIEE